MEKQGVTKKLKERKPKKETKDVMDDLVQTIKEASDARRK